MEFALGTPGLLLYPPVMSPWEASVTSCDVLSIARKAEYSGWDWLTVSEHIVMPREMAPVMGSRFPEAMVAASVLAGATSRIKLLTYVLVLPYRDPLMLAKQVSTLDSLSGGRFALGLAVGHLAKEFEALGVPFNERGKRSDEYLAVMKELWTSDDPHFEGRYVEFKDLVFEPKPLQKPHPPVLIGGNSRPAMRRAARAGDGWLPWLVRREQLPECLDYIRAQPGFAERAGNFEVLMPLLPLNVEDYSHRELGESRELRDRSDILDEVALLAEAGTTITHVVPPRTESLAELLDWLEWFGSEVIEPFAAHRGSV